MRVLKAVISTNGKKEFLMLKRESLITLSFCLQLLIKEII